MDGVVVKTVAWPLSTKLGGVFKNILLYVSIYTIRMFIFAFVMYTVVFVYV